MLITLQNYINEIFFAAYLKYLAPIGPERIANITAKTPTVVFCLSFNTKGLDVSEDENGNISINKEGSIPKFINNVRSISFSAKRGLVNKQKVLYITERCVFELCETGLRLTEVYPGIDMKTQILDLLPFEVEIADSLK